MNQAVSGYGALVLPAASSWDARFRGLGGRRRLLGRGSGVLLAWSGWNAVEGNKAVLLLFCLNEDGKLDAASFNCRQGDDVSTSRIQDNKGEY